MTLIIGRKKGNSFGYTLIELILAALIIAILIGVAMPLFRRQFSDLELRNSSYNIAKLISLAQRKAIGEGRYFKINFDFENKRYWLTAGDDLKNFERLKTKYGKRYSVPSWITIRASQRSFTFFPNGSSDKIEIILSGKQKVFSLKSKGRLGHVEIKRIKIE